MDESGERIIASEDAWGATVSRDGSHVAYCLGHLVDSRLLLHTRDEATRVLGPGAYPAWHPEGRYLLFSVPEVRIEPGGVPHLAGGELFLIDVTNLREVQLTSTEHVVEMEPVFSPHGQHIAFADWREGALYWTELVLWRVEGEAP